VQLNAPPNKLVLDLVVVLADIAARILGAQSFIHLVEARIDGGTLIFGVRLESHLNPRSFGDKSATLSDALHFQSARG
jgi:hypothetical protein